MSRTSWLLGLALVGVASLVVGAPPEAEAAAPARRAVRAPLPRPIAPPAFRLTVEDGAGRALPVYRQGGTTFVLGEMGQRYTLTVHNPTSRRVEAVVSVDGRDVLTGEPADYAEQRGYVVPAYGSVTIRGFRRSLSEVATFRFTDPGDSYSARWGTPENVGILGLAIFAERERPELVAPPPPVARGRAPARPAPPPRSSAAGGAPRSSAEEAPARLGTGYGESRYDRVSEVSFERASARPLRVITLRYDDAEGLEARGIRLRGAWTAAPRVQAPRAFPGVSERRFAQPPP